MPKERKKKTAKLVLPAKYPDYSHVKPPTRPAIEWMLENLHNAGKPTNP